MHANLALVAAAAIALTTNSSAAPIGSANRNTIAQALEIIHKADDAALILIQNRGQGGGRRSGSADRGGNFNSNNFHKDVSGTRNGNVSAQRNANVNANRRVSNDRNVNVNANRNVNVSGGSCCNGSYDDGPSWGGVAAGVAVGAVVGAAVSSAASAPTYVAPPPTYPPGYVTPPPY